MYQLTEEVITKKYDNDKFLTEVIEHGKSRRIAIIGEPGAGKTTPQEKIAVWIHDKNKGLPICSPYPAQSRSSEAMTTPQLIIQPSLLMHSGVQIRKKDDVILFRFTDELHSRMEELLEKKKPDY